MAAVIRQLGQWGHSGIATLWLSSIHSGSSTLLSTLSCHPGTMHLPDKGKQLFLGEGDFSLTRSLCEKHQLPKDAVVTCYAKELTDEAANNSTFLQSSGITVMTGVDATKLETYEAISTNRYDYIIFNFPHTGHKTKIHLCRALLRKFLCSAAGLLADNGQVWVTLCAGQGGTAGDPVRRAWADSWQLTDQAAAAGLVLRRLEQFDPELVSGYRPTGNRGCEDRGFHVRNGVSHVLVSGQPFCLDSVQSRLSDGQARLLLGGAPLPLAQYWLRRLPPADDSLASHVVRRLAACTAAGVPLRHRVLVRRGGRLFSAGPAELQQAAAGGDLVCQPAGDSDDTSSYCSSGGGGGGGGDAASLDVCVTYTVEDGDVAPGVAAAPLRTRLRVTAPAAEAPDPRHALAAFGLACKETRQDGALELRVSCGGVALPVADVSTCDAAGGAAAAAVVTTFDVDAVAACWAGFNDWRHAVRSDFHADGAILRLDSIHPPSYTLDMSFWVCGGEPADEPFSFERLRRALRAALGELLVRLEPLDEYEQPKTGRRARTVRLEYQDLSGPLAYEEVRRLHVEVLPEVLSRTLGVQDR